ncbi:amino acid deaminase [Nocardia asteroides NBRC 15531]|uniref:amino acid deaminase n=1 Tax=Nocardia asteroides TaxID=1824 RepID=UPI00068DCC1F|nr:amino acid deaminase [Nocardia asteroides]TLF62948.1 amino acid deaminase [Nocardia asteroides NBRC 15531]UGT52106.1 amino acid deaminase [Nocardia asteroides]VEG34712.1 D-threonine aldolase [Nocardia asteroides]
MRQGRSTERDAVTIDNAVVDALADAVLGPHDKSVPPAAWGRTVRDYLAAAPDLAAWQTPLLTLDRGLLDANIALMAEWTAAAGVALAPHGKTTMAPQLWRDQLVAGSWAITLATGWQAQLARSFGVGRIMLANTLVDPAGLAWVATESARDTGFECYCWADSVATVDLMDKILRDTPPGPRVRVLVELGGPHGRTGARTRAEALAVAAALADSDRLTLAGVSGYEGALAHDRSAAGVAAVRGYLAELAALHTELAASGAYAGPAIVTAGGSAYPELVVGELARLADATTTVVLRSGAYLVHDDGFYAGISPLTAPAVEPGLRAAMHGWARVVSRPEPELALLDGGKRDFPFDEGLPVPQLVVGGDPLPAGAEVTALNDQHAFLRLPGADAADLPVGSIVRLGLSHPCTAFDKWRRIPVLDSAAAARPRVVDLIHTYF